MKNLGAVISIPLITIVFIYSMIYLSRNNICDGVRVYDCTKQDSKNIVSYKDYIKLKKTGDIFLKNCKPLIKEEKNTYFLDYSKCNLKISIDKQKSWIESVSINGKTLNRKEINTNF